MLLKNLAICFIIINQVVNFYLTIFRWLYSINKIKRHITGRQIRHGQAVLRAN